MRRLQRTLIAAALATALAATALPAAGESVARPSAAEPSGATGVAALEDLRAGLETHAHPAARDMATVMQQGPVEGIPPQLIVCGLFVIGLVLVGAIPLDLQQVVGQLLLCLVAGAIPIPREGSRGQALDPGTDLPARGQVAGGRLWFRQARGPGLAGI